MKVVLYTKDKKVEWDNFVEGSKNGTFILMRSYMDYHSDRFKDFSLMFYEKNKLIALLPASISETEIQSHGGLTYGGIISGRNMTVPKMLTVFEYMKKFLKENNIKTLIYKCIPKIYHTYCADEDLYALYVNNAILCRRDISTCICLDNRIQFSELRTRCVKKAKKNGITVKRSFNFNTYISILTAILDKYHNAVPVHSAGELSLLSNYFPDNMKLFGAYQQDNMLAGIIIFETEKVVHTQYIANSDEGRNIGALDLIVDYLISIYDRKKQFLDFGISTEKSGRYLNTGLINQKEMFGGRAVAYDFYKMEIN